ncbi:hypothetical protein EPA93_20065 [Ktedonosporobacter rubrisoli]|uniref:GtrA/DPMS transmembrane domain-containing protein n=1 Tax=Ktedonosporobacter rubrisoli TaxID=2509675 RepID=A0A4P6JRR3_KTERU|nr:GtrA family protein [Ktedonosporobacter rubrisoli]QBD78168.1 hypothetical protein EPA93_20065 [Ktedonosporobacter rubrisoli]
MLRKVIKILLSRIRYYRALYTKGLQKIILTLLSNKARPVRFILTGGLAGLCQLGLLALLLKLQVYAILANALAFFLAAQVNFVLSTLFTWRDRQLPGSGKNTLLLRWLAFHGSILGTALLNMLVFTLAHLAMPALLASALGIIAAAIINFTVIDRFVFSKHSA